MDPNEKRISKRNFKEILTELVDLSISSQLRSVRLLVHPVLVSNKAYLITISIYGPLFSLLRDKEVPNIDVPYLSGLAIVLGLVLLFGAPVDKRCLHNVESPRKPRASSLQLEFLSGAFFPGDLVNLELSFVGMESLLCVGMTFNSDDLVFTCEEDCAISGRKDRQGVSVIVFIGKVHLREVIDAVIDFSFNKDFCLKPELEITFFDIYAGLIVACSAGGFSMCFVRPLAATLDLFVVGLTLVE
uniref:Uncharacterized protein n=1 Tax=Glossina pallidipes TaxID=7398 RepID=A0A1A9ZJS5_GLOPL